jgi:hypothetical protein
MNRVVPASPRSNPLCVRCAVTNDVWCAMIAPLGQPPHQLRCVCGEEVIAGRRQIDVPEARCIQPHALDASDDRRGQTVEQRDLIDRVLTMIPVVQLPPTSALRSRTTTRAPALMRWRRPGGKTGAYDDAITLRRRSGVTRRAEISTIPRRPTRARSPHISGYAGLRRMNQHRGMPADRCTAEHQRHHIPGRPRCGMPR